MLTPDIENVIRNVMLDKGRTFGFRIVEVNGTLDHVRVLIQSRPVLSPAEIAKLVKGSTSHYVNHVTLKDDKTRRLYWQDGYGVITVSPAAVSNVESYIRNQKKHHAEDTIIQDWEYSAG